MVTSIQQTRDDIPVLPAMFVTFRPLEVVSRYRDTQLQVGENYSH